MSSWMPHHAADKLGSPSPALKHSLRNACAVTVSAKQADADREDVGVSYT
jgi:hypothetical protein